MSNGTYLGTYDHSPKRLSFDSYLASPLRVTVNNESSIKNDINKVYDGIMKDLQPSSTEEQQKRKLPHQPIQLSEEITEDVEKKEGRCIELKKKKWWTPLMSVLKFGLLFAITMLVLYVGAVIFASIEDPEDGWLEKFPLTDGLDDEAGANTNISKQLLAIANATIELDKKEFQDGLKAFLWSYIEIKYGINISISDKEMMHNGINILDNAIVTKNARELYKAQVQDRQLTLTKWIYFTAVATTTIGYGDVHPETKSGKYFYIIFSIVGIPLMMLLLKASGELMTLVNKTFFRFINKCLCKEKKVVSEELLSTLSIFLLFVAYVCVGCVFNAATEGWTLLDAIYFWIVTFTTVGFGDVNISHKTNMDYFLPLLLYRIFGLALLAGVIDSLLAWLDVRKAALKNMDAMLRDKQQFQLLLEEKMSSIRVDVMKRSQKISNVFGPYGVPTAFSKWKSVSVKKTENTTPVESTSCSEPSNINQPRQVKFKGPIFDARDNESVFGNCETGFNGDVEPEP